MFRVSRTSLIGLKATAALFVQVLTAAVAGNAGNAPTHPAVYRLQQSWKIGGAGGWNDLTIDVEKKLLYLTRSDRLTVVNSKTGSIVKEVTGFGNAHDVCLDNKGKFAYVSDGSANVVRVIDRETSKVVKAIPVGSDPDAILCDTSAERVIVANHRSHSVTVIDSSTQNEVGAISIPGMPGGLEVDGKGALFVSFIDKGEIARIGLESKKIEAIWPVAPCVGPSGLAMDRTSRRLFSTCENEHIVAISTEVGNVVAQLSVGSGSREIEFDAQRKVLYTSTGDGTVSIIRETPFGALRLVQKVKTAPGARTMAFDAAAEKLYLPTAQFGLRTGETSEELRFRPTPVAGSFTLYVVGRSQTVPPAKIQ
jgi:YVTN family beta-propeller protein